MIAASQNLQNNRERLLPSPFGCSWLCMSCLLDRDLGNMSYTVYLDMIWGQSVGFKQRGRRRLTERLHYLKWLFVFNFTFQLISSGSGHREVITDADEPARTRECVSVFCSTLLSVWMCQKHAACLESWTSAETLCVLVLFFRFKKRKNWSSTGQIFTLMSSVCWILLFPWCNVGFLLKLLCRRPCLPDKGFCIKQ